MRKQLHFLAVAATAVAGLLNGQAKRPFSVVERTSPEMRWAMEEHRVSSRDMVVQHLTRIALYENKLHAVITVNPNALQEAEERDREFAQGHVRGPLHGIPIAL